MRKTTEQVGPVGPGNKYMAKNQFRSRYFPCNRRLISKTFTGVLRTVGSTLFVSCFATV
jgi:hypothetical protein